MEKVPNWERLFVHRNNSYSYRSMWTIFKWLETSRIWHPRERIWWRTLVLMDQHHFLTTYFWDVLNVNANRMKISKKNTKKCLNHVFLVEHLKSYQNGEKNSRENCSVVQRHRRTCSKNAWKVIATWRIKRQSTCIKFQVLVWMTIKKSLNKLENYLKYACLACTWPELVDLTFCGQSANLPDQSQNGLKLVTDAWPD